MSGMNEDELIADYERRLGERADSIEKLWKALDEERSTLAEMVTQAELYIEERNRLASHIRSLRKALEAMPCRCDRFGDPEFERPCIRCTVLNATKGVE